MEEAEAVFRAREPLWTWFGGVVAVTAAVLLVRPSAAIAVGAIGAVLLYLLLRGRGFIEVGDGLVRWRSRSRRQPREVPIPQVADLGGAGLIATALHLVDGERVVLFHLSKAQIGELGAALDLPRTAGG